MGCALTSPPPKDVSAPPTEKIFQEDLPKVWGAIQFAMSKYPVKLNDQETGVFETQYVRGEKAWNSPGQEEPIAGGQRYKISIRAIKGKPDGKSDAKTPTTKVIIQKRAEVQRDFFTEFEKLASDGQEEMALMYRIERELEIASALSKIKK